MFLIDDLLLSPISGFNFILRTLSRVAQEQYTDDAPLKERLLELQVQLEQGHISEQEYQTQEAQILRELREVQNRKRELAGLPPEEVTGISGKVQEGSGATVHLQYGPKEQA